jgi:hypothetical protein
VPMTSQSADKRRIESPLHEGVALGMVLGAQKSGYPAKDWAGDCGKILPKLVTGDGW